MLETDVLVVGAGPAGITLANLLGTYGVRTLGIDRDTDILDFPRAVGVDDESLRTFQAAGLVHEILADILQNTPIRYYSSTGRLLAHVKPSAQPFGWPRRNNFLQPLFEATLRRGAARFPAVTMRYGCELVDAAEDPTGVACTLRRADGAVEQVRARFVVGCDGGRSLVRRLAGIALTGETAAGRWVVADVREDQLDRPYSAVYCHPKRPTLMVPLPYRHRRFEFKLAPGDDEAEAVRPEAVMARLAPFYGSTPPPGLMRARVYWHHSRIAETFRKGRLFLAGDAAHLQPPFFGQGMNSGIRDVGNLAWKLALVVNGRAGESLLDTYDAERRGAARDMVWFATMVGSMYTPRNRLTEMVRDVAFRALQLAPGGKEYVLQMKYKPMPRYTVGVVAAGGHPAVGKMFVQPDVEAAGVRRKLDEVLGAGFAVLGLALDAAAHLRPESAAWWRDLGARFVQIIPSRSQAPGQAPVGSLSDMVVEDVDGVFRDLRLARPMDEVVVLRPDRYVAAVCGRGELERVTAELKARLA